MEEYRYQALAKSKCEDQWMSIFDPRGPEVYTGDIKNAIDIITLDQSQPPKIVGSFKYRVHRYPGDLDMLEFYQGCCTLAESKRDIVKKLKEIAARIKAHRGVYLGDFKAGTDERYDLDIGENNNGDISGYDQDHVHDQISKLYSDHLLTKNEALKLYELSRTDLDCKEWKELHEALRKLSTIRWNLKDLDKGSKTLRGGKVVRLSSAISQGTVVKIDIFTKINGRYTEVTNFFALSGRDEKGNLVPFTEPFADYHESLQKEIEQRIKEGKYLKVAKRIWLLALDKKDIPLLRKLYKLFSSPAAEMRQMAAEAETLAAMIEHLQNPPMDDIKNQIDGFKLRIADIPSTVLSESTRQILYDYVEDLTLSYNTTYMIEKLAGLEKLLAQIYDTYAKAYLDAADIL